MKNVEYTLDELSQHQRYFINIATQYILNEMLEPMTHGMICVRSGINKEYVHSAVYFLWRGEAPVYRVVYYSETQKASQMVLFPLDWHYIECVEWLNDRAWRGMSKHIYMNQSAVELGEYNEVR